MKRQVLKKTVLISFLAVTCASYMTAYSRVEVRSKLVTLDNKIQGTIEKSKALAASSPEKALIIILKIVDIVSEVSVLGYIYHSTTANVGVFETQYKKVDSLADDLGTFLG